MEEKIINISIPVKETTTQHQLTRSQYIQKRHNARKRRIIRELKCVLVIFALAFFIVWAISSTAILIKKASALEQRNAPMSNTTSFTTPTYEAMIMRTEALPVIEVSALVTTYDAPEIITGKIYESEDLSAELQQYAKTLCDENDFDLSIFMAIMYNETRYQNIVSSDGMDSGICQIRKSNLEWLTSELGEFDVMNEKDNMNAAMFMLQHIQEVYEPENITQLLMMYNQGPTGAKASFAAGNYSTNYSETIQAYAANLQIG